jgi:hypothetical protein
MKTAFGRGLLHQRFVHLERPEDGRALGGLVLEAHAHAHIGVDRVRALGRGMRILQQRISQPLAWAISRALVTISMSGE